MDKIKFKYKETNFKIGSGRTCFAAAAHSSRGGHKEGEVKNCGAPATAPALYKRATCAETLQCTDIVSGAGLLQACLPLQKLRDGADVRR